MPVVSISINDNLLEKLEELKKKMGYTGRSEIIRSSIRSFIDQQEKLDSVKGNKSAIIAVKHHNEKLDVEHDYAELIKSQLHNHNSQGKCLQTFVVEGDAQKIVEMHNKLKANKEIVKATLNFV